LVADAAAGTDVAAVVEDRDLGRDVVVAECEVAHAARQPGDACEGATRCGDERPPQVWEPDVGPHERDRVLEPGHAVGPALEVPTRADAVDGAGLPADVRTQTVDRARLVDLVGVDDEEVVRWYEGSVDVGLAPDAT